VPERSPVILIVCDTLRADHLGFYGYSKPTSPFLDRLAARSWVYEHAYSSFSYTWPTVTNLFTGIPYSQLVARQLFTPPLKDLSGGGLVPANETLAERLAAAGVRSAAVSANPYVTARLGFGQGFSRFHDVETWDPAFWKTVHKYSALEVNPVALAVLDELTAKSGPWFLYLHYFDPHMPYLPPQEDRELFAPAGYDRAGRVVEGYLRDPRGGLLSYLTPALESWLAPSDRAALVASYDAEIHLFDRGLERLFAELERRGLLGRATVILTADHGEAFLERGFWGHGFLSRQEEEHVPLLVVPPVSRAPAAARISDPVTTSDLFFSLLRHFGAALPDDRRWWAADPLARRSWRSAVYAEGGNEARILRSARFSYYFYTGLEARRLPLPARDGEYLFDLIRDPGEAASLFAQSPARAGALRDQLLRAAGFNLLPPWPGAAKIDPLHAVDEEGRRRLRALGYLGGGH